MSVRHIQIHTCDRCKKEFQRSEGVSLEIGWFKLTRGSGSKLSTPQGRPENLDKDLCEDCTDSFFDWWKVYE